MLRMVWLFSLSAFSLAMMFSCTYSRAMHSHSGQTTVLSSGRISTSHPRLCSVITSIEVATSPRSGSLVQQSRPLFREQKGGRTSKRVSSGGFASMVKMAGLRLVSK
ncbi:11.5 kDa [Mastadenovirus porcusquartum]|uniref:11.5 kDa n=1 Tax=Mastadenovirus porcusquartum TaxID=3241439 RepID=A0A5P9VI40_9ADEN|nr:11.5 kDa [Porcine mastadenovirus B]QFX65710.1 11.5 kDa [Porcine mastadenovirus B]